MRVLVTGGTGFVGLHFVQALLDSGASVRVPVHHRPLPDVLPAHRLERIDADLTRPDDCARCCADVDWVVHAAGGVGAAGVGDLAQMQGITLNLVLTARVLEAAWAQGVKKVLLFGSSTGYPPATHPVKESEMWSADPYEGYFGYGWMRRYIERLGELVDRRSTTRVAVCRPPAVYGRHDSFDAATSHVMAGLIRRAVEGETPLRVWGDGREVRDFLHVTDLARGGLALLGSEVDEPLNLGSGEATTVGALAGMVLDAVGRGGEAPLFDPSKPTAIPFRLVDITRARHLLGFAPRVTLGEGVADTVEWYRTHR